MQGFLKYESCFHFPNKGKEELPLLLEGTGAKRRWYTKGTQINRGFILKQESTQLDSQIRI